MRAFLKKITHPFLKLGCKLYYFKPRTFRYAGIAVKVHPDVFPPQLTFSTKILLDFVKGLPLENKTFLELGCGSGIISLLAAQRSAIVTASDINNTAIEFLKSNASRNNVDLKCVVSDLFQNLENQTFDYIIVNPPYYPQKPKNVKEQAWFCGENFEYFEKLFLQLPNHLSPESYCYMILSQDCDIVKIKAIAQKNTMDLEVVLEKKDLVETNYIFRVSSS